MTTNKKTEQKILRNATASQENNGSIYLRLLKTITNRIRHSQPPQPPKNGDAPSRQISNELLFEVIRNSFISAGVLSASYKFKILPNQSATNGVFVLIDVGADFDRSEKNLQTIEKKIVDCVWLTCALQIKAVYWKVGVIAKPSVQRSVVITKLKKETPAVAMNPLQASDEIQNSMFDQVSKAELAAFEAALKNDKQASQASQQGVKTKRFQQHDMNQQDFEDTETFNPARYSELGQTQYANLGNG